MCKVIEFPKVRNNNAALNIKEDGTKVLKRPQLSIQEEYTKEELEWIEGIKEQAEFWSDSENNKIESDFWTSLFNN